MVEKVSTAGKPFTSRSNAKRAAVAELGKQAIANVQYTVRDIDVGTGRFAWFKLNADNKMLAPGTDAVVLDAPAVTPPATAPTPPVTPPAAGFTEDDPAKVAKRNKGTDANEADVAAAKAAEAKQPAAPAPKKKRTKKATEPKAAKAMGTVGWTRKLLGERVWTAAELAAQVAKETGKDAKSVNTTVRCQVVRVEGVRKGVVEVDGKKTATYTTMKEGA
jgi:hypothetical protein